MADIIIRDNMTEESKIWKIPMIWFFILAALFPLVLIWNEIKTIEFVLGEMLFVLLGSYFLYGYLYTYQYEIIVTKEKIVLKTLFERIEIEFEDIETYTCKRYRKSRFYQFSICCKNKIILINTRYKNEFEKILQKIEDSSLINPS